MQSKVLSTGFRSYQVLNVNVDDEDSSHKFDRIRFAERVIIKNTGENTAEIKFNAIINDSISISADEEKNLPIKTDTIWVKCPTANDTTTLNIIGFKE